MSTAIQKQSPAALATLDETTILALVAGGDCSRLTPAQKTAYYTARCEAAGLDPRAQPFAFMRLNGKEVLYALKAASDQLAAKHGVRTQIVDQRTEDGIRVVTVRAETRDGRSTDEIGALPVKGIQGEALANAMMKCVTKAKRRAVLSICGLGMPDETELETVPHAEPVTMPAVKPVPAPAAPEPPRDLAEEDETRRKAQAIANAVEQEQAPVEPTRTIDRRALWARLVRTKGSTKLAQKYVDGTLGRVVDVEHPMSAAEWEKVEDALDAEERDVA